MSATLQLRLRNFKDDDIRSGIEKLCRFVDSSDVLREALRFYLFGEDTPIKNRKEDKSKNIVKQVEVKEVPVVKKVEIKDNGIESKLSKLLDF